MVQKKTKRRKPKHSKKTHKIMRPSSGDLVAIQISARIRKAPKGFKMTRALLEDMIREKARTSDGYWDGFRVVGAKEGNDPPGIHLAIIRWKNPDRLASDDTTWRYANPDSPSEQADAWGSLRRIILTAPLSIGINR